MAKDDYEANEGIAVDHLKLLLYRSTLLKPYIDQNDRTPSWDGFVFVYDGEDHSKANIIGRVPVQVKSTIQKMTKISEGYSLEVSDLRNYYNDRGCIVFVVCIDKEKRCASKVYYADLQVYDLKKLLDESAGQKKKTILIKPFPSENTNEMSSIFLRFLEESHRQASFWGKNILSPEQLKQHGAEIEGIAFHTSGFGLNLNNVGSFISNNEFYLYAKLKGSDIEIPFDKMKKPIVSRAIENSVSVAGKVYYDSYNVEYKCGKPTIKIGKAIIIDVDEQKRTMSLRFCPQGYLRDFIRDLECYIAIIENKGLVLGNATLPFIKCDNVDIEVYKKRLQYCQDVRRMFDALGVKEDLLCENLSKVDEDNIRNFVYAVLYNRGIGFPGTKESVIHGPFKIGNLSIWIWATKQKDDNYKLESFFAPHKIVIGSQDQDPSDAMPASHYLLLSQESFVHASNMDYQCIIDDIRVMNRSPKLVDVVTFFLLDVLHGYDKQTNKDSRTLELADEIVRWLESNDAADKEVLLLNKLQITKRRGKIKPSEIVELSRLTRQDKSDDIRCGAYILLDDMEEAQKCFDNLPADRQNEFLLYPICLFGKPDKKKTD